MDKVLQHLLDRGMNPHLYGVSWDEHEACIPLRNLLGDTTGYLRYRPWGDKKGKDPLTCKYKPTVPKATMAVFGVETLAYDGPIYLVEGAFKACKLHNLGYASIAVQGSDPSSVRNQVYLLRQFRQVVCIGDNDKAGRVFTNGLGGFVSPQDLDEMTDEAVKELLNAHN
jgi:hypothetical protein